MDSVSSFIDKFWNTLSSLLENANDPESNIFTVIRDKFFAFIIQWITEGWTFLFGELLNSVYRILFSNYSGTVSTGKYAVDRLFSFQVGSQAFSVDMIYFFFGLIMTVFIFKFVIHVLLKCLGLLR